MPSTADLDQLFLAFRSAQDDQAMQTLVLQTDDASLDALEAHVAAQMATAPAGEAAALQERLTALQALRSFQQQVANLSPDEQVLLAFTAAHGPADIMALANRLVAWIQQPDWDASQRFLAQHAGALLGDAADAVLTLLLMSNAGNDDVQLHHNLLAACRAQGIGAAYAQLFKKNRFSQRFSTPVGEAVLGFVAAESDEAARQMLHDEALLLTADAQRLLAALVEEDWIDADAQPQVQRRLAQWHEAWRARAGGPRRSAAGDDPRQPDPEFIDRLERQPLPAERAPRYHVVTAINSAIGPGASVLNIYEVGALPLAWRTPQQTRPDLARSAVGRAAELEELHRRLTDARGGVALVGMRGIAGIGKTWLAAMYATTHAATYPGGVIWVDVGPRVRRKQEVTPLLQKLAAHAYAGDVRVAWLDEIVFAADAVQLLLSGHGRLLLIFDDVWSDEVAAALRAVAPAESAVLLTTRDRRVAYALGHGPDAIQELDVLTPLDARALLQRRAPGLDDALADAVAKGLGYHALALDLAGAALFERGPARHERTAAELLRRVAAGRGFGDLPLEDRADAESNVEIILRYTYDYLGEDAMHGAARQAGLRALGTFAQEASFDTAAVAALWQCPADAAEARLLLFDQLALLQEAGEGRWRQHAILRAYAYSLQTSEERLALPQRHADYYWEVVDRSIPANTDRVAREFDQVEHSFGWCRVHSPARAARLAARVSQVMMIRGRAQQAGEWLAAGQEAARASGDRGNQANTLKSLGDLESRLGNIDAARRHYDAALPLYEAEQARLGKANTLQSLGDLESRLGNIDAARRHYAAALPLYEAEQARLGKANTLKSLGDLERRLGNIDAARRHYDAALPLYEAEQARLGKANTLKSLGDLESRLGNIDAARRHYDAALPLYEAEQARLGKANTLQSLGDLESRLGNIDAARRHYDAALPLYEAEQARLGKANTLKSLGDLERRLGNIDAARRHYDAALPLYEAEQARLGKANTLQSLGDLESRLGNIDAARRHYDAALPLYEAEQARLGKANTLKSLGDLERRLGNIDAARRHYDAALPLYEAEQARLGKANTLKSLGDLERRLGNIDAARRHYDAALPLYEAEQDPVGKMNVFIGLARLEASLGNRAAADAHYQHVFAIAESIGFGDHPVTQNLRQEYAAFRQQENTPFATEQQTHLQQLADLLVAWVQRDDLDAQARFLHQHAADLLTDEGEQALQLLVQASDHHPALVQAQPLLARCRAVGVAAAYAEVRAARDNPLLPALAALLAVEDDAGLRQALIDHPVLAQPQAALALGALLGQALAAEKAADIPQLVIFFAVLVEQINQTAENDADIEVQAALVDLCDQVIALVAQIDGDLADGLRTQAAWACNTLGNAHAQRRDPAAAVAAYTRGLGFDAGIAMLLRNRAGEQLGLDALDAARADIEQAAALEPDASRLPLLWCDYYAALGDGAAMQPYLAAPVIAPDRAAEADYHRAVMHTLLGDHAAACAAMSVYAAAASDDLRRGGATDLQRLARRHAHLATEWAALAVMLGDGNQ